MNPLMLGGHVPAVLTQPGGVPVAYQRGTVGWPSPKRPVLADKTIAALLKDIQEWDNTVYIDRPGSVGSQPACL